MRTVLLMVVMQGSIAMAHSQRVCDEYLFFDVTFWKKKLHLSHMQLAQLHSINCDMYCALYELANADCIESSNLGSLMQLWKTATLGVLSERQKRRWKKLKLRYMTSATSAVEHAHAHALS